MIAPIRFLFIIQPNNEGRFKRAMDIAYMIWGGIYSPILPCYQELPQDYRAEFYVDVSTTEYYINSIENFDPDLVFYDEDLDQNFIKSIVGERDVLNIDQYLKDLCDGYYEHAISVIEIAEHLAEKEFKYVRRDNLKFVMPKMTENDLLLHAFIGKVPDQLEKSLQSVFENSGAFERPEISWKEMNSYQASTKIDLIDLNHYKLKTWANKSYKRGSCLYFLRSNRLQDVMNFWNLRAAGWMIVPMPVNLIELPYFAGLAERFVNSMVKQPNSNHAWITQLIGHQIQRDDVEKVARLVRQDVSKYTKEILYSYQQWFPRFWHVYEIQDADQIKSHIPFYDVCFDHYDTDGHRLTFKTEILPFEINRNMERESAYKVIISLSVYDEHAEYAQALTGITTLQLRQLIQPTDFRKWRLSSFGMHRMANKLDDETGLNIPKALDFFKLLFSNRNHKLEETVNSKLAKEVLRNIGGIHGAGFF